MNHSLVMALDMGTSSVRAMLFDVRGKEVPEAESQLGYAQRTTADGGVETDAEVLLDRTLDCIRILIKKLDKATQTRIAGVGISCFWHSLVGVGADNRALTPVYSWADTRSHSYVETLRKSLDATIYHARTGCELHPSFWPAKLLWLADTQTEVFVQVTRWMSFGEYLILRLFGSARCSVSMASGTGLFNQNASDWDDETLGIVGIDQGKLNSLTDRNTSQTGITKEFARGLGSLANIPWFPAVGDGACSNAGSSAIDDTRVAINVGTSGAMRIMIEADHVATVPGLFCYRVDRKRFLLGGAFANGGNVYAWLHEALQLDDRAVASRRLGTMPPDSHGLTVLPLWAGERSPGWHGGARATISGMNLHTTSLDILRASLEAVAYSFDVVREALWQHYPEAHEIVASGGALVHDPVWVQIMADVFGCSVVTSKVFEASSRGAALLALESLGLISSLSAPPAYLGKRYEANLANHKIYANARQRTEALYHLMLD